MEGVLEGSKERSDVSSFGRFVGRIMGVMFRYRD